MASKLNVFHNDYCHCLVTHNFLVPDHKHEYNYSTAAVIISMSCNWLVLHCALVHKVLFFHLDHTHFSLQFWQTAYMLAMSVLSLASLFAQVHPKFLSNHWYMRRLFLYAALMFAGIVPVLHWVVGNGGFSDPLVQVTKYLLVYDLLKLLVNQTITTCN